MSLIGIEESILVQLSPLKQLNLDVRGVPNQSNRQGLNSTHAHGENGRLLLYWESDRPVEGQEDLGAVTQTFESIWTIEGRITNLRDQSGILRLRDLIYNRLLGFQPTGALSPLQAVEFQMLPREENRYVFETRFSCQTFWVGDAACADPDTPVPGLNATLKELLFVTAAGDLKDQWNINKTTEEIVFVAFGESGPQNLVNTPFFGQIVYFDPNFSQPLLLENTFLETTVTYFDSEFTTGLSLENTLLVNTVTYFDSAFSQNQVLENTLLTNTVSYFDPEFNQNQRLENTLLTNTITYFDSVLNQSQQLENTLLINTITYYDSTLEVTIPWTPQDITTQLWLRGTDNVTLSGANVTAWADVKDTTVVASQSVTVNQPTTATLDGKTTVSTVGGKYLDLPNTLQIRSAAFIVNNFQASNNAVAVCVVFGENDTVPNSADYVFLFIGPDYTISIDGNNGRTGRASLNGNPIASGTNLLLEETYSAGGGPAIFYVDWTGAQVSVDYISAFNPESGIFQGSMEIAEIILFPEVLSAANQNRVVGRLAHDWGQTGLLPASHPYKTEEPSQPNPLINTFLTTTVTYFDPSLTQSTNQILENTLLTNTVTYYTPTLEQNPRLENTLEILTVTYFSPILDIGLINSLLTNTVTYYTPTLEQNPRLENTLGTFSVTYYESTLTPVVLQNTLSSFGVSYYDSSLTQGSGVTESISGLNVAIRPNQIQTITDLGGVDWWIAGIDEKSGGTAIAVTGGSVSTSGGAPIFNYSDGTTNTGDQQQTSQLQFGTTPPSATVAIPAGSGRVSVWCDTGSTSDASLTAAFGSNSTGALNFNNEDRFDIDFTASAASTMTLTLSPGSNANAGFFAIALTTDAILSSTPAPDVVWFATTEGTGTQLVDPYNGWIATFDTTTGTMTWDAGDGLLQWAGGAYVVCSDNGLETLIETTSIGTILCWANPDNLSTDMAIFTSKNNTTNEQRMLTLRTDIAGASGGGTNVYKGSYRTNDTPTQGTSFESATGDAQTGWHHVTMVYETGVRFRFWKNAVELPQANFTFYPTVFPVGTIHSQGDFHYGNQGNLDRPWSGKLYDLRLYSRVLSQAEIQAIYDATKGTVGVT